MRHLKRNIYISPTPALLMLSGTKGTGSVAVSVFIGYCLKEGNTFGDHGDALLRELYQPPLHNGCISLKNLAARQTTYKNSPRFRWRSVDAYALVV